MVRSQRAEVEKWTDLWRYARIAMITRSEMA